VGGHRTGDHDDDRQGDCERAEQLCQWVAVTPRTPGVDHAT
jgi:hypothetical protein